MGKAREEINFTGDQKLIVIEQSFFHFPFFRLYASIFLNYVQKIQKMTATIFLVKMYLRNHSLFIKVYFFIENDIWYMAIGFLWGCKFTNEAISLHTHRCLERIFPIELMIVDQ